MDTVRGKPASHLIILVSVLVSLIANVTGDVLTACYDGSNKTVDIDCGAGSLVRIVKTFYGFSPEGECSFREGHCTLLEPKSYDCVGQSVCNVPLKGVDEGGVLLPACHMRSNYFQVEYQCVLKNSMHDICSPSSQLTAQSGHIVTPSYPVPYFRQLHCNVTVRVAPQQKVRLNIVTMQLTARGKTDCADTLYFNDKLHSLTLCGRRANTWYDMHSNVLTIELKSSDMSRSQGFWLYYEAFPPLPTTPPAPVEPTTVRPTEERGSVLLTTLAPRRTPAPTPAPAPTPTPTPIPIYRDEDDKPRGAKSLPFAAIAGGVIGSLSLVLIILLMLLLIKWLKERRYFKDEKFLEIRNPAFRSSGDFNEPNNYNYA